MPRTLTCLLFACALLLSLTSHAFGYGGEGHRAVGLMAQQRLNQRASTAVANLLKNDKCKDLACVATWPDELKQAARFNSGPLAGNKEALGFQKAFPTNDKWHFVNLPLATDRYTDNGRFSKADDVVHMINTCIAILEGKSKMFLKIHALRFLVHLTGDIHQPLHVGVGFYNLKGTKVTLIEDPDDVSKQQNDIGGNVLFFTKSEELHAFWDTCLIQRLTGHQTCVSEGKVAAGEFKKLVAELDKVTDEQGWKTEGDFHKWAEQWATDSVREAKEVYEPITFGAATMDSKNKNRFISISIMLPATYADDESDRARTQIAKAGVHLAQLLNSIDWK